MNTNTQTFSAAEAAGMGLPPTFHGYTPDQAGYWREPGVPWVPSGREAMDNELDRQGFPRTWYYGEFQNNHMAPRFPAGTVVNLGPVQELAEVVVGKVYGYARYISGEWFVVIGRVATIYTDRLAVTTDNRTGTQHWPLNANGRAWGDDWHLHEVTHYVQYPAL